MRRGFGPCLALSFVLLACRGAVRVDGEQTREAPRPERSADAAGAAASAEPGSRARRAGKRPRKPRAPESGGGLPDAIWASREDCQKAFAAGARLEREPGAARLAAWNVRWFPDGIPGRRAAKDGGTDLEWLACALAFLDADVVALSEVKAHGTARVKLERVLLTLGRLGGGEWHVKLDECTPDTAQHVGLIWNAKRVKPDGFEVYAALNPRGAACQDSLRPGLGGYFRFPGGLDLEVVAVHLKSGGERRAFDLRQTSLARLAEVRAASRERRRDDDLLVLGDFNSMGCPHCSPPVEPEAELAVVDRALGALALPFARLPAEPACSHYFSGRPTLLDLAVAPRAMRELGAAPRVRPAGLCAERSCRNLGSGERPEAQRRLSDHCPIVIDLVDQDLDE